ncbi:MAG: M48 family metallopeptidase [Candidatus Accumulibacter sp.]|nr:M48 family metallopeptidase [Candidatus Accumulibacter necessarius]
MDGVTRASSYMRNDPQTNQNPAKALICYGLCIAIQPRACHPCNMNHSPRFWAIVARLCPDYRAAREKLKRRAAHCPNW